MMTATNERDTGRPCHSNIRAEAQAFGDVLLRLYESENGWVFPPVHIQLTGRQAKHRMGHYSAHTQTIILHDGGMSNYATCSALIQELAHHIQHNCSLGFTDMESGAARRLEFEIHHCQLRDLAVSNGLIPPLDKVTPFLASLGRRVRELNRLRDKDVLQIGKLLWISRHKCRYERLSFRVFLEDCVPLRPTTAYECIRAHEKGIPPDLKPAKIRFLVRIKDVLVRQKAIADALDGVPLRILRLRYPRPDNGDRQQGAISNLSKEKTRLQRRLAQIDEQLRTLQSEKKQKAPRDVGPKAT